MDCPESRTIKDLANNPLIDLSDDKISEFSVFHKGMSPRFSSSSYV